MLSVYSCGCRAENVPCTSTCPEHGGYVLCNVNGLTSIAHKEKSVKVGRLRLLYAPVTSVMSRIRDEAVGLVISYVDSAFFAFESKRLTRHPHEYFEACSRTLRDDAHMLLVSETSVLDAVLHSSLVSGLHVCDVSLVRAHDYGAPTTCPSIKDLCLYKSAVLLSKSTSLMRLSCSTVQDVGDMIIKINPKGTVVDTSCIYYSYAFRASRRHNTIGILSDHKRFEAMVRKAREN